jgi:pyruvate-ferredoxin/flavodoxin oxidoreductase
MGRTQNEEKKAVECGYWQLYRYDPRLAAEGKNPFQLDSKEPDFSKMEAFMKGENRYLSLSNAFPEKAQRLYNKAVRDAQERYARYRKLAEN